MRINGLDYHLEENGQGQPLLLLHGFTGSSRSWDDVASRLAQRYRIIRADLPGHGKTEFTTQGSRYTMSAVAQDLAQLLTACNAAPAHVLGYSMGGRLALFFALTYPSHVQRLIIESGSPGLAMEAERAERRTLDGALAERIERDGIDVFVNDWERLPIWASQSMLSGAMKQHQREIRLANNVHGLALSLRGMGTGTQPSLWDRLSELTQPTAFIAGELDSKFATIARDMHGRVPAAQLSIIPNAGHTTHLEQPDVFVAAVVAFLSG